MKAFCETIALVGGCEKLLSFSMDGPSVNWKFLTSLQIQWVAEHNAELINVGSCGLHIVHGAFQSSHTASGFKIQELLSNAYYLFKDSPARRADFIRLTGSKLFPLKFCRIRWCENARVANRFLTIKENLTKYCSDIKASPKVASFDNLQSMLKDPFLKAEISFFISVALIFEPFLKRFQSEQPLLPYLCEELMELMTRLGQRYLKDDIFSASLASPTKLNKTMLDATEESCKEVVGVGVSAEIEVKRMKNASKPQKITRLQNGMSQVSCGHWKEVG